MDDTRYQRWPDGTKVRFNADARRLMQPRKEGDFRLPQPLRTPVGGAEAIYTIDNTKDNLADVILRENGERWAEAWLEAVPRVEKWEYALKWDSGAVTDINAGLSLLLDVISRYPEEVRLVRRYVGAWEDAPEEKV